MGNSYTARAARALITVAATGTVGAATVDDQYMFKLEMAVL